MPVYPIIGEPLIKSGHYPHMMARDVPAWERFLDQFAGNFNSVAYNVALGGQLLADPTIPEADRLMWRYSTALKPDAVLFRDDLVLAVEVKPEASTGALGQALCYATMLEIDGAVLQPIYPAVVCQTASPDLKFCAEELGVLLYEVGIPPAECPAVESEELSRGR